jgi:hypothetical protein
MGARRKRVAGHALLRNNLPSGMGLPLLVRSRPGSEAVRVMRCQNGQGFYETANNRRLKSRIKFTFSRYCSDLHSQLSWAFGNRCGEGFDPLRGGNLPISCLMPERRFNREESLSSNPALYNSEL